MGPHPSYCWKELLRDAQEADRALKDLPNDTGRIRQRVIESRIDLAATLRGWVKDIGVQSSAP